MSPADRRQSPRVPVSIWVEEYKGEDLYLQQAGNLSVGGVFFERTIPHPIGTRVRLRFQLPGRVAPIEAAGEVVSTRQESGMGAGIRFVDLPPEIEQAIQAYVSQQIVDPT
jgi:uncharacterized protein (TIGR02266 family)